MVASKPSLMTALTFVTNTRFVYCTFNECTICWDLCRTLKEISIQAASLQ